MTDAFIGPIIDVRFVLLRSGQRIMQVTRDGRNWTTPQTAAAGLSITDEEGAAIENEIGKKGA